MKRFSNYGEVKANEFDNYEKLELGGHLCKILKVRIDTYKGENGTFENLVLEFDLAEGDKQAGFYARRFQQDANKDALNAKWKGIYRIGIPKDDGSEKDEQSKVRFKTFITCIEKSNPGYDWEKADWDETTLVGKKFVGVFGLEEFESTMTGEILTATKCKFTRSTEGKIEDIAIPKVKLIDGTLIEYDDWVEKNEEKKGKQIENAATNAVADDDSLPF